VAALGNEDHGSDDATFFERAIDDAIDASAQTDTVLCHVVSLTDAALQEL
jgi:hypothetical protein